MRNNRSKINKMVVVTVGIWFISLLAFATYCYFGTGVKPWVVIAYGVWNLLIFAISYRVISLRITTVMQNVDDSIQSLIDGNPRQHFSMEEETVLGKFQMQIMKLYQMLKIAKEREEKMRTDMSELVSDLVHQVNTPLTNIQMYCEFLLHDDLSKGERRQACDIIEAQVEKLGWFAEGFSKTARLEDDIMHMNVKKQPVVDIVLRTIDQIALKAEAKQNEIVLEGNQNVEATFDSRWTEEAVFNLLDNAVKYGESGRSITLTLTDYEMFARIDVSNWGEPIKKEEYNRIFTRFYRGTNASFVQEGVGLGLYLTRQIVMEQGGYVKVSPYRRKGNIFSIFLPK